MHNIGNYIFDSKNKSLTLGSNVQGMTQRESDLLLMLCQNINSLTQREEVLEKLWGFNDFFNARSMDVFIVRLRNRLKEDNRIKISNVRAKGYILSVE